MKNFAGYPPMTSWQTTLLFAESKPVQIFNGIGGHLPRGWHRSNANRESVAEWVSRMFDCRASWISVTSPVDRDPHCDLLLFRTWPGMSHMEKRNAKPFSEFELKLISDLLRYTPTADWYGKVIAGR